jgi:adenosylcobinamide-GDP ribazoletransferase
VRSLLVAAAFLTRIPIPIDATASDVRTATRWFPAVGAALGASVGLLSASFSSIELPPLVNATLVVSLVAGVTGAIHLDGLADTADGFGGGRTKDDVLRIMRDPRLGSFGAVALILVLALKVSALAALIERHASVVLVMAALTLSRWTVVALGSWLPYARPEGGLGQAATGPGQWTGVLIATGTAVAVSFATAGMSAVVLWVAALAATVAVGATASARIGGVTGDVFGAVVEISETAILVAGLLVRRG